MIHLRLLAVGGVVALLLWAMEDKAWIEAIRPLLFPLFSIGTIFAVASFEAQDRLARTSALFGCTLLAAFAPGLLLTLASPFRDVSALAPFWLFLAGLVYACVVLTVLGWLFLGAAYAGVSLCRDEMKGRPWTDAFFFALLTVLFAVVWFTDAGLDFRSVHRLGWGTLTYLYAGSAVLGGLTGWLFYRLTGYPVSR